MHDEECAYELSPVTRWRISGAGAPLDADVPPQPVFGLSCPGEGRVEVGGVGFSDLINTRTIASGTLTLHYFDELSGPPVTLLSGAVGTPDVLLDLSVPGTAQQGGVLQIDSELVEVEQVLNDGLQYQIRRGVLGSAAAAHAAQAAVYHLKRRTAVMPFARDFFGSPSSGTFAYSVSLPDARIASAEFFASNVRGNGQSGTANFTSTADRGLRTLSGGQFSIQVEGWLAIQSDAAPPLVVQDSHAVRDVFAMVREAPAGGSIELQVRQNETAYCSLIIPAGATVSNVVSGSGLPPLTAGSRIHLDVIAVPQGVDTVPGSDLTVAIRM